MHCVLEGNISGQSMQSANAMAYLSVWRKAEKADILLSVMTTRLLSSLESRVM